MTGCECSTLGAGESLTSVQPRRSPKSESSFTGEAQSNWPAAVHAAESKKAIDVQVLDLREVTSFTDFFVICSVTNPRQGQAVCDAIQSELKQLGDRPVSVEGYEQADWILMDYGDFLVHIFSENARKYYDLERLWRPAKVMQTSEIAVE
ncbi:MAG TPA: ribosome silencing factor [Bryobacteraceae bacterium]|nr:ribosome silencing factor [Bryobacteraceae bacterium]